jgi:hypothetical protein
MSHCQLKVMFPDLWPWVPSPLAGEGQGEGAYSKAETVTPTACLLKFLSTPWRCFKRVFSARREP